MLIFKILELNQSLKSVLVKFDHYFAMIAVNHHEISKYKILFRTKVIYSIKMQCEK